MVRVNLSDTEAGGFEPFPAGRYPLNVFDGEIRTSESDEAKHPGSQYIAWDFTVAGGEYDGRHVWSNTIIDHGDCECSDGDKFMKGLFALKGLLAATAKWSPEEMDADEFEFEIDDVLGSVVVGTITIRKSEQWGDSNEIKRFKAADEAALAASSNLP